LAEAFLIPRLAALQQQHPGLDLEIVAERNLISLQRYQSDIALRLGRPDRGELIARRVARVAYRFYGTPIWRNRLKQGKPPCFVGFDEAGAQFPEALWLARRFGNARLAVRCNNQSGQIAAARASCGIAMLPCFLAAGDPALVEIKLPESPPTRELWLLNRSDVHRTPRIRAVTDFLIDLIRRERAQFEAD
jgi:DNA-binding transcriptional LysR family regulator